MASRRRRAGVLLGAVLAAFACGAEENSAFVAVAVNLNPPVQAASFPAQVLVRVDSSGAVVFFRVGFLCSPDASFSSTVSLDVSGIGDDPTADVLLVPVESGSTFTCGPLATPEPVPSTDASGQVVHTTAELQLVAGCSSG